MKFFDKDILTITDECGSVSLPSLMIPLFFEMLFVQLLGTVNTIILSDFSEIAVEAVGVANQFIGMLVVILSIIKVGSTIFISISFGSGNPAAAHNAAGLGVVTSLILGVAAALLSVFFATPAMRLMQVEGAALSYAVDYFRIRMAGILLVLLSNAFLSYLRCNGHSVSTFAVGILQNIINLVLSYLVIFQPFPFPLEGVSGIAYAALISQAVGLWAALLFWKKHGFPLSFRWSGALLRRIVTVGAPGATSSISYSVSQVVTTAIIVSIGGSMVAAKVYFSSIFFYVYLVSLSLGQAGSIMIGRYVGHQDFDRADRLYRQNLRLSMLLNAALSFLVFLLGQPLMRLFTDNPEILAMTGSIMLIDILVEVGRGMNHIGENALNGAGDVVPPMIISMSACWGISVLFSYIFGVYLGMGLIGCWLAFMLDELFRGCFYFARWRSGKWKKTNPQVI